MKGAVAEGKVDVWEFSGHEGDPIIARVNTREDDVATGVSSLHPVLTLLDGSNTPVIDSPSTGAFASRWGPSRGTRAAAATTS